MQHKTHLNQQGFEQLLQQKHFFPDSFSYNQEVDRRVIFTANYETVQTSFAGNQSFNYSQQYLNQGQTQINTQIPATYYAQTESLNWTMNMSQHDNDHQ
eukprot:403365205